jgi:hypothetical protein
MTDIGSLADNGSGLTVPKKIWPVELGGRSNLPARQILEKDRVKPKRRYFLESRAASWVLDRDWEGAVLSSAKVVLVAAYVYKVLESYIN